MQDTLSAGVAESADAQDLKSCGVTTVPVQVWSPAPKEPSGSFFCADQTSYATHIKLRLELVLTYL